MKRRGSKKLFLFLSTFIHNLLNQIKKKRKKELSADDTHKKVTKPISFHFFFPLSFQTALIRIFGQAIGSVNCRAVGKQGKGGDCPLPSFLLIRGKNFSTNSLQYLFFTGSIKVHLEFSSSFSCLSFWIWT